MVGKILYWAAGLVMFAFEIYWFFQWWGGLGLAVGLFVPPLAAVFPFVYLFMEGFSLLYFGVWALGVLGMVMASREDAHV